MKFTSSILAAIVLFLSTQCLLTPKQADACEKKVKESSCCMIKKKACTKPTPQKETKDKGCGEACNPFMSCSGCTYTIPERPEFELTPILPLVVQNGYHPDDFTSSYISTSWHPPESFNN